jgi:surface antigen
LLALFGCISGCSIAFHTFSSILNTIPSKTFAAGNVRIDGLLLGDNLDVLTRKKGSLLIYRSKPGCQKQSDFVRFVAKISLVIVLGLLLLGLSLGVQPKAAHATSSFAHHTNSSAQMHMPPTGAYNWFGYPWCTWWADERYHQLHGVYVPWSTQSDAWQWTARAYQFGWSVSTKASPGAIINLQPWVQGAYGLGHVAVVEKVYSDGSILASNTSWGANPYQVVYVHFYPGPGVTFIQW